MSNKEKNIKSKISQNKSFQKTGTEKRKSTPKNFSVDRNNCKAVSSFIHQVNPESKKKCSNLKDQLKLLQSSTCCENQSFNFSYRTPKTTGKKQLKKEQLAKGKLGNIQDEIKLSKSYYKSQQKKRKSKGLAKKSEIMLSNSDYELENQRIQRLKLYIQEDSNRFDKLKQVRDEHILHELGFTQKSLQKLRQDKDKSIREDLKLYEENELSKISQKIKIQDLERQVKKLKQELDSERGLNEKMKKQVCGYQQQIDRFKKLLYTKELDEKNTESQTNRIRVQKKSYQNLHQEQTKKFEQKINSLEAERNLLAEKLTKRQSQCQTIKKEAKLVLQIIQQQINQF